MRAEEDGLAPKSRFQQIMSSHRDQGSTHVGHGGMTIGRNQFSSRIQDHHARPCGQIPSHPCLRDRAAPADRKAPRPNSGLQLVGPFDMPGRHDQHKVPVFVPAFVDSELGNDIYIHNIKRKRRGKKPILIDLELDSKELIRVVTESKRFGIFSIGGGVPRNNVQNVAPLIEIINERLGPTFPNRKFTYGVRICPDRPHFGHLSGCTYSENESWRKADKNGIYAEMLADATQVWPFLVKYLMEKQTPKTRR